MSSYPLAQATLLRINPPERHGTAMAIFGTGTVLGPMMGPVLGGWFTEYYSWRYVFYINLPIGVLCSIGVMTFMRWTPNPRRDAFDFFGFLTLSIAIGAFQLMLDRGNRNDWFNSVETWVEATIAGLALVVIGVLLLLAIAALRRTLPWARPHAASGDGDAAEGSDGAPTMPPRPSGSAARQP